MRTVLLLVLATPLLTSLTPRAPEQQPVGDDLQRLLGLAGAWQGELEYADFGSGERVLLPLRIEAETDAQAGVLLLRSTVNDPGRQVHGFGVTTIDTQARWLETDFAEGAPLTVAWEVVARDVAGPERWTLVTETDGTDGGRPARLRKTHVRDGDALTTTTEYRPAGAEQDAWAFRNAVRLRRVVPELDAAALVGTWRVDLRPTPDAQPYFTELAITSSEPGPSGALTGSFYGAPFDEAHLNREWGALHLAFTTEDGTGTYHTTAVLRGDRLEGTTHSLGRDFLSVWTAERAPSDTGR